MLCLLGPYEAISTISSQDEVPGGSFLPMASLSGCVDLHCQTCATEGSQRKTWGSLSSPPRTAERLLRPSRKAAWSSRYFRQMARGERLCQFSGQTCPRRLAPYGVLSELVLPRAPCLFLVLLRCVLSSGPDHEQTVSWAHLHPPQAI